jgi:hypothetical protein
MRRRRVERCAKPRRAFTDDRQVRLAAGTIDELLQARES